MWWGLGGAYLVIWFILMVWLGVRTIRNNHVMLFILGIFLPIFWVVGAFMRPASTVPN